MASQWNAVNHIRMRCIVLGTARHVGGQDVRLLVADTPVNLVEPNSRATLGGQEKLGQYEKAPGHRTHALYLNAIAASSLGERFIGRSESASRVFGYERTARTRTSTI